MSGRRWCCSSPGGTVFWMGCGVCEGVGVRGGGEGCVGVGGKIYRPKYAHQHGLSCPQVQNL